MSLMASALPRGRDLTGVVVSAGKMMKTVKVRIPHYKWNNYIRKDYAAPYNILVSDPNSSLVEGDVVTVASQPRIAKHVHHVVKSVVSPFRVPLTKRPPVLTPEERLARREVKSKAKTERRAARRVARGDVQRKHEEQKPTKADTTTLKAKASRDKPASNVKMEASPAEEENREVQVKASVESPAEPEASDSTLKSGHSVILEQVRKVEQQGVESQPAENASDMPQEQDSSATQGQTTSEKEKPTSFFGWLTGKK